MNFTKFKRICIIEQDSYYPYIFYFGNFLFCVLGCGSLSVGIWLYTEDSYSSLAPSSFSSMSAAGLCVSIGSMSIMITVIGSVGIWIKSNYLLMTYFCFVILLLIVQSVTGLLSYFFNNDVKDRVKYSLYSTIYRSYSHNQGPDIKVRLTWDLMQTDLNCCGVNNYTDWFYMPLWPKHRFVPDSCCNILLLKNINTTINCGKTESNNNLFYKQGCFELFSNWLLQHLFVVGFLAMLFIVVEIFLELITLKLLYDLHKKNRIQLAYQPVYRYSRNNGSIAFAEDNLMRCENI